MAVEFKHGDYIKSGWELTKSNLVPCIVAVLVMGVLGMIGVGVFLWGQIAVNMYKGFKDAKASGKPMEIGALFNFDNFVNNLIAYIVVGVVMMVLGIIPLVGGFIGQALFLLIGPILADKPGIAFMDAVKAAIAFSKGNFVPCLIFTLICFVLTFVGMIPCGLGVFVTVPITMAATWLVYDEHKAAVAAAAAEMGVTLA
jgi:uncharacterized membrane protein